MISVVVPVYNEEPNLPLLMDRLESALRATGESYEIIYVDDGSRDNSLEVLKGFVGRPASGSSSSRGTTDSTRRSSRGSPSSGGTSS